MKCFCNDARYTVVQQIIHSDYTFWSVTDTVFRDRIIQHAVINAHFCFLSLSGFVARFLNYSLYQAGDLGHSLTWIEMSGTYMKGWVSGYGILSE
jgi:hypothetical protein